MVLYQTSQPVLVSLQNIWKLEIYTRRTEATRDQNVREKSESLNILTTLFVYSHAHAIVYSCLSYLFCAWTLNECICTKFYLPDADGLLWVLLGPVAIHLGGAVENQAPLHHLRGQWKSEGVTLPKKSLIYKPFVSLWTINNVNLPMLLLCLFIVPVCFVLGL